MLFLVFSLVALAAGPLLAGVARRRPWAVDLADGFVVVAVGGLVVLHVVPSSIEMSGPWALVAALLGLIAPLALERFDPAHDHAHHDHHHDHDHGEKRSIRSSIVAALVLCGVAIHAILDGAAMLELGQTPAARALAISVVIHRIPVGLAIWWLVRPRRGLAAALTLIAVEGGGGIVGFLVGGALLSGPLAPHLSLFQAALAGALLHVLAHHAPSPATGPEGGAPHEHVHAHDSAHSIAHAQPTRFAAGIGALLAIAFVAFVTREHPIAHPAADELGARAAFFALARIIALPLLIACAVAGIGHVILPQKTPKWLARSDGALGAMRGLAVGMLLPVCSCGIVPLHRTLADKRLVPSAAAGILVASPELGPAALLLSWALLGPTLFVARICTAAVAALACAFVLTNVVGSGPRRDSAAPPSSHHPHDHGHDHEKPRLGESLVHAARFGFVEMLDHTAPWLLAGLLAAALAEPTIPHDAFVGLSPFLLVPAAALAGVPFYVSASAAMPVLAVLLHKGLSPGAAVAFLLTAPAVTPATIAMLDRRFGKAGARLFALAAVVVAIGCGLALDQWMIAAPTLGLHAPAPRASDVGLAVFCLLVAASLLRQGPRAMLGKLLASG
ncbi:MAG TPA: permease [Polyangiaceae bacterium]